jgi:hypothetical protein
VYRIYQALVQWRSLVPRTLFAGAAVPAHRHLSLCLLLSGEFLEPQGAYGQYSWRVCSSSIFLISPFVECRRVVGEENRHTTMRSDGARRRAIDAFLFTMSLCIYMPLAKGLASLHEVNEHCAVWLRRMQPSKTKEACGQHS